MSARDAAPSLHGTAGAFLLLFSCRTGVVPSDPITPEIPAAGWRWGTAGWTAREGIPRGLSPRRSLSRGFALRRCHPSTTRASSPPRPQTPSSAGRDPRGPPPCAEPWGCSLGSAPVGACVTPGGSKRGRCCPGRGWQPPPLPPQPLLLSAGTMQTSAGPPAPLQPFTPAAQHRAPTTEHLPSTLSSLSLIHI